MGRCAAQLRAAHHDRSCTRAQQPGDGGDRRRFSRAVAANERDRLAATDLEVHTLQDMARAVVGMKAGHGERAHRPIALPR